MDKIQQEFDSKQKSLIDAGVVPADAILLTAENKIQRVVEQCRRSHGGPISDESEVEKIIIQCPDDKRRKSAHSLEIRFRKFTVLNIKESNPLFKQQNLSVEQLCNNLRLLLKKTDRALASTATMDDLEHILSQVAKKSDTVATEAVPAMPDVPNEWPPAVGEHVVVRFEDGWYIGEVLTDDSEGSVDVSYMKQKKVATADPTEHPRRFWIWPAKREIISTKQEYLMPIRPDLVIARPPSTRRMVVFSIENAEIIDKFV